MFKGLYLVGCELNSHRRLPLVASCVNLAAG